MKMRQGTRGQLLACSVVLCAALLAGCYAAPVTISPSTHPITGNMKITKLGHASGDAWGVILLGFPLSEMSPAKAARDRAIKNANADALIDVTADYRSINLMFIAFVNTHVEGEAVRFSK